MSIRLLLVSAHPLVAQSYRQSLESLPQPIQVTLAGSAATLSQELRSPVLGDLLLLIIDPPPFDLALVRALRGRGWAIPILVLCSRYALPALTELRSSGVQGIISSAATLEELAALIYALTEGRAEPLAQQYTRLGYDDLQAGSPTRLSAREREILQLVAQGLPDKAIAARVQLSTRTVSNYLSLIYAKLGVNGRADAVAIGLSHGFISPPGWGLPALPAQFK